MTKQAWYVGCSEDDIGQRVILVGDPARVSRLATELDEVVFLPENRGLRTITGRYAGTKVTVAAFGMGAPIAAIVLHELAHLGARVFLRIGTAMALPPLRLGEYLIASDALCREGTSLAYVAPGKELVEADPAVAAALEISLQEAGLPYRKGRIASFDAFYRDMFALEPDAVERVNAVRDELLARSVLMADMETSAILTVGRALGVKAGSFCVASVDNASQTKLDPQSMEASEAQLFTIALETLTRTRLD